MENIIDNDIITDDEEEIIYELHIFADGRDFTPAYIDSEEITDEEPIGEEMGVDEFE